jgi:peptidoglycan/xylan/chitin deacetylase (PgdA/CDA1 family)
VPRHIVCLTFDFDTQSGFIARGLTTPTMLSRGEFGLIGARRILDLLRSHGIPSTWFIPGHTIETYPERCREVREAGHEIGHHGWTHVPPANLSREEEEAGLVRANEAIRQLTGQHARGYRSPSWDLSDHTVDLLLAHGFLYDSSLMGADYVPYRARRGDRAAFGEPYRFGEETALIEMPISWTMDDHPHFEFLRVANMVMPGLQSPRVVMQNWLDEFRYMKKSVDWGVLTYTMHPYVIGRGYRMLAFEELVAGLAHDGAEFRTMEEAALEAQTRLPRPSGKPT